MKKIIAILLLSLGITAGAAACGSSGIALTQTDAVPATEAAAPEVVAESEAVETTAAAGGQDESDKDTGDEEPSVVCVYVCGAVMSPGVYNLPEGARIYEALALAGGLTAEADTAAVNQAQALTDGMMIRIPAVGESVTQNPVQSTNADAAGNGGSGLVNLNTADAAQLCTLPGIGETKAAAILQYREQHGGFTSKDELMNVSGIGEATYRNLESLITIS